MQSINSERLDLAVIGLHCAEESDALRRALVRHPGVSEVHVDQVRGRVRFEMRPPATLTSVSTAASRAGLRLLTAPGTDAEGADTDRPLRWAGTASLAALMVAVVAQFIESGGAWTSLVVNPEFDGRWPASALAYGFAAAAAATVVLPRAWRSARGGRLDMNVLVLLAIGGALWLGEIAEAATVAALFAGALLLEAWSAARARRAVAALMQAPVPEVWCCDGNAPRSMLLADVRAGMALLVKPGARVPVDAEVTSGHSLVDESMTSGEAMPMFKRSGDTVLAGSVNGDGVLEVRSLGGATDSRLARMLAAASHTREGRTRAERSVERFARVYTPVVVALAVLVWVLPPLVGAGTADEWFRRALVVVLVACPCALVISTPVTLVAAISAAARRGVLVKGGEHLERIADLAAVAFDKTGVVTIGRPRIVYFEVTGQYSDQDVLAQVAAIEARSEHPLATALVAFAADRGVDSTLAVHEVQAVPGRGVSGHGEGGHFWIGNTRFLDAHVAVAPAVHASIDRLKADGMTVMVCGSGVEIWAVFGAVDRTRADAVAAVRALRGLGVNRLVLISGDDRTAVAQAARELHVDDAHGECTPEGKAALVAALATHGSVAMVGDGLNDVPALAAATVAVAVGPRATDAALDAADIVLLHDDLSPLPWLVSLARRALGVVRQNLWLAIGIKVAVLAAATAGEASLWMAVLADTGATVFVTLNGLRLLGAAPPRATLPHTAT